MRPRLATISALLLAVVPAMLCSQGAFIAVQASESATASEAGPDAPAPPGETPEREPAEDRTVPGVLCLLCQDAPGRLVRSPAAEEPCLRASLEPAGAAWAHVRGLAAQRVDVLTLTSRVTACSLAVVAPPVQPQGPPACPPIPAVL